VRIELQGLVGVVIAQKIIKLGERRRNVLIATPKNNIQPLVRVSIE
jgi:hypothetical protein